MNICIVAIAAFVAAAAAPFYAAAQVKVFDRPPTVEELRASLAAKPASAGPATSSADDPNVVHRRGLVWNPGGANKATADAAAPAAQATAGMGAAAGKQQQSNSIALPINFEPGSSRLSAGATSYIEPIASLLRSDPGLRMAIEGHTDASGSPQRNLMLSWDRAMTVFKLLVERYGIDPVRLQPVGKGSMEPMDQASPEDASNRRVQFRPLSAG